VRHANDLVADIERHGRLVLDLASDLDEAAFVQRFGDGITPFCGCYIVRLDRYRRGMPAACRLRRCDRGSHGIDRRGAPGDRLARLDRPAQSPDPTRP
jgi:hypothetical protein